MSAILPRRRYASGVAALALAAALVSPLAAQEKAEDAEAQAGAAAEEAPAPDVDAIVATVNGTEITLGDVILMRANLPQQYQALPDEQLFEALVEQIVTQTVLAEKAAEDGLDQSRLAKLRARADSRNYLAEAQLRREVEGAVTEDALRAAYDESVGGAEPVEEIRASHILVESEEEAKEIRAEIEGGADFAELAKEKSTGPSGPRGGDLGWFEKGAMVPEFADAAFALEAGEVSDPVQTQFGWHVIKLDERRTKPTPTFEEMRDELEQQLQSEAAEAAVLAARESAEVTRPDSVPPAAAIRRDDLLLAD